MARPPSLLVSLEELSARFLLLFDIELFDSELASEAVEGVRQALSWESGALGPGCGSVLSLSWPQSPHLQNGLSGSFPPSSC